MSKIRLPLINAINHSAESRIDKDILARWDRTIMAAQDNADTITIYDAIGQDFFGGGFTAKRMSAALRSIGANKDVVVSINSPGGDVFEGITIYNLLAEHKGNVTVNIPGMAASAASIIAMAGDSINISKAGFLMIHNAWAVAMGNQQELMKTADMLGKIDSAMCEVYSSRSGMDKKTICKMMDAETWLSGQEAVDNGLADGTIDTKCCDPMKDNKQEQALARRSIENALAKAGFTRKEREDAFKNAFGVCDTTDSVQRDAEEKALKALLKTTAV